MAKKVGDESATKPHGARFGCLLSFIAGLAIVGLAITLGYLAWYSNAQSLLDTEVARIRKRGEPLWFNELVPAEIDPNNDGTPLYFEALQKMQAPSQAFTQLVTADAQSSPSADPVIIAELAKNREVLDLLAEAIAKPDFRLPMEYDTVKPFTITLDPVQSARDLARLLAGDVTAALAAGEDARAFETAGRMFDLSELLRKEPFVIAQLVRVAIATSANKSLQQTVSRVRMTPEQFIEMDERLDRMERQFTLVPAMIAERAATFTTLSHIDENIDVLDGETGGQPARVFASGALKPNLMADMAFLLQVQSDVIDVIDKPGSDAADEIQAIEARVHNAPKSRVFTRLLIPSIVAIRNAGLRHREKLITARLGLRVIRFYGEHQRLPESLDEICDAQFPSVPQDLLCGKPFVYKRFPDGFVIYSVGPNGIDDGGGATPDAWEANSSFEVHFSQ